MEFFLCLFAVDTLTQNRRFIFTFHYSLLSYCISRVAVCAKALQKDIVALRLPSWCGDAQPCYKSHIASLSFHSGNRSPDYLLAVSSVLESIHFKLSRCVRHQPRHPPSFCFTLSLCNPHTLSHSRLFHSLNFVPSLKYANNAS